MKFIHLTDTHVVQRGKTLYGGDPVARLAQAVSSINAEHSDANFVVLTGDVAHWGDEEAYAAARDELSKLTVPLHLLIGNHDEGPALSNSFPEVPRDENGFFQAGFDTEMGRCLLLDTKASGTHAGAYCEQRRAWLGKELAATDGPVFLFMHHPPFPVGIKAMDHIMMQDAEAFSEVLAPHRSRIRHLFFGHVHRAIFGNWRGTSFSCMRGLNHQVSLQLDGQPDHLLGNFEPPAYGVSLVSEDQIVVHLHDFSDDSKVFDF